MAPHDAAEGWIVDRVDDDQATHSIAALVDIDLPAWTHPDFDAAADRARARLEALITDPESPLSEVSSACATLVRLTDLQDARAESACRERAREFGVLAGFVHGLDQLEIDDLVDGGAAAMCGSMGFRRTLFSTVSNALWMPKSLFIAPDVDVGTDDLRSFVAGAQWRLDLAPLESEVIRRRAPRLVHGAQDSAQTFKPLMEMSQSRSYVVAPIWARRRVIGLLHADRWGDTITEADLDLVDAYAQCFGAAAEQAMLRRRLTTLAHEYGEAFGEAGAQLAGFECDHRVAAMAPSSSGTTAPEDGGRPAVNPTGAAGEFAMLRDGPLGALSPREADVLVEMSHGQTNAQIAVRLCLTEGTVKSYVKQVLRKLDVPTRAAATARVERWRAQHRPAG